MLTKITVKPGDGWVLWKPKDDTSASMPIEPGDYYTVSGRIKAAFKETFKNRLAPLAATNAMGHFNWLLPYEKWVKVVYDGQLQFQQYGLIEDTEENREELARHFDIDRSIVDGLRDWQRRFIFDFVHCEEEDQEYRRGGIVRVGGGKTRAALIIARRFKHPVVLAPTYCWNSWIDEAELIDVECPKLSTYQSAHKIGECDALFLDEALLAANPNTKLHQAALDLSKRARGCVALTGTPQSTTPMDLRWLRVVHPGSVPADEKPWRFLFGKDTALVEVKPTQMSYVTKTWDQEAVSRFVSPYVMVVKPEEIVKELPEITYQRITVPCPSQYELILKGAATEKGKSKALAQARMCTDGSITDDAGRVLAHFNTEKLDAVDQFVQGLGEPVVIFARWAFMVENLAERFVSKGIPCSVLRAGGDHTTEVERFRSGGSQVLVASADLCQGMNLQERARVVMFTSNSLKPTNREQAIGRVYRPGQKRGVVVVDVVAEGTLDEVALKLLDNHRDKSEAYIEAALRREFEKQMRRAK
jgi:hypothetical protein